MSWIRTYSGKHFSYVDISPDNVCIEDIAHALSNIPRFCGHLENNYTVAQHSVILSQMVNEYYAFEGLMHDATEAYLCDVPSPAKQLLPEYVLLENKIWREAIAPKFKLAPYISQEVHDHDKNLLKYEMDQFIYNKSDFYIEPLNSSESKKLFMDRFHELHTKEKNV